VRDVIERAQKGRFFNEASPILFIDEIHRFSKSQQDSLLGAVEKGIVYGTGVHVRGEVKDTPAMEEAYRMGLGVN
ncbi:MAG: sigma 54-interacting transcriptional regulator, partial [Candidatus Methanomethylophilaceae archaeon]|nr:sigma 54-interacting transcriptional regulator [Candidatus Methanomethylophilaceae archaeon]